MSSSYPCEACGCTDCVYAMFSGGREYYCPVCESNFPYPPVEEMGADAPRAVLLQTEEGRIALRAQMDQELARLAEEGPPPSSED